MSIVFVAPGAVGVVGGLAAVGIAKRFPSNESALGSKPNQAIDLIYLL